MLNRETESKIIEFLAGLGLSKSRSRKILQSCRGSQPVKMGGFRFKLYGDRFVVDEIGGSLFTGLDLNTNQLI